jgi:hypothetical protein
MDVVERLRDLGLRLGIFRFQATVNEAADEIERLREALKEIEYLDRPQIRGLPRRVSIHDIALAALKEGE